MVLPASGYPWSVRAGEWALVSALPGTSCVTSGFVFFTSLSLVVVSYYCCNKFPQTPWLKTTQAHYFIVLEVRSLKVGLKRLKSKAVYLLEALRIDFLPFPAVRDCSHSLAPERITLISASIITSPFLTLTRLPLTYKDPSNYIGPTWITHNTLI